MVDARPGGGSLLGAQWLCDEVILLRQPEGPARLPSGPAAAPPFCAASLTSSPPPGMQAPRRGPRGPWGGAGGAHCWEWVLRAGMMG